MASNFKFLEKAFPVLFQIGDTTEKYLYTDANSCLIKLGMFGETVVNLMMQFDNITPPTYDNTHSNRIKLLKAEKLIPREIDEIFFALRKNRNLAIHENYSDEEKCKSLMGMCHSLGTWFNEVYGDININAEKFVLPKKEEIDSNDAKIKEQEATIELLNSKITEMESQNVSISDRISKSRKAASNITLSEKATRLLIDEQLRKIGWEVDTDNLKYSNGTRPRKGLNIAIAEWPTNAISHNRGFADYALFIGEKLVGIIEAKKFDSDVPTVIDVQCKDYAKNIKDEHKEYLISKWGEYDVPFIYATNGRKYLKQIETKSGVWSLDLRDKANIPKALQSFHSPSNIIEILEKDIEKSNEELKNTSYDLLKEEDGLNLRNYQIKAIEKAEEAILSGKSTALLSMATGTGKTRTILGMIYRFLKAKRFNRILFLVDRTSLGEQATDVFKDVKLEDLLTLDKIYNINNLDEKEISSETKIQISTVQSLVKRILHNDGESMPGVSDFDLIIIDEAHRGYTLNKELDEDELLYRDQDDFLSSYRTVIDYFDSVKIALTATPALHTTEIFGNPVFNYSYREAVVDGYLVDHDAPHDIKTKLRIEGINFKKGEIPVVYDSITGEVINSAELEDDLKFDIEQFNRKVITLDFNRAVLEEISNYINPEDGTKTLIYAVDDSHADLIVDTLRKIYEPYGIDGSAIMKITGKSGDKKRVLEVIKQFKNGVFPSIAVTVDLLTTGIDVPEINKLVFMRRVKSRILFEQMLGRATRLCNKIGKTHFEIFDPVGVYESLEDVSTMKPVVANSNADFEDLISGLSILDSDDKIKNQIDKIVAKIRRKKLNDNQKEQFEVLSNGKTIEKFIEELQNCNAAAAKEIVFSNLDIFGFLSAPGLAGKKPVFISEEEDEVVTHTRGYGDAEKPEDYLESFKKFIEENEEKIEALKLVCTRPTSLTRKELKALKLELDKSGFTETKLNTAISEMKNEEIVADIISLIRSQIGAELQDHEERIIKAVNKLKKAHKFNQMQISWLNRIEKYLLEENILDDDTFEQGAFKTKGGFIQMDKIFQNKLKEYMTELNKYLYEDGGKVA